MKKPAALYFEIHTGSSKPYGYIRNSYRKNKKVCHDTISRINGCSISQLKAMKAAFDGKAISRDDIKLSDGREYVASAMLFGLAKKSGWIRLFAATLSATRLSPFQPVSASIQAGCICGSEAA